MLITNHKIYTVCTYNCTYSYLKGVSLYILSSMQLNIVYLKKKCDTGNQYLLK